jgi:hypothetical protein
MSVRPPESQQPNTTPVVSEGWESERDTERAKVTARWFAILLLLGALLWIRHQDTRVTITNQVAFGIAGAAIAMTAIEAFYLWHPGVTQIPRWLKYVTVSGDMVFISVLIYYTGFTRSPFFFVYFVFLISNCLRYGLLMSLFVAASFNVLYSIVLGLAPPEQRLPSVLGGEGIKIAAFWAVALYGGAVSARLRRQANQLRVYEETILELRSRLGSATASGSQPTEAEV